MPRPVSPPPAPASEPDRDLTRTYALVFLVEVLTIAALYWLSRAFA
jgi:hypothetical protein